MEVTVEDIIAQLRNTPDGRNELDKAHMRATIAAQAAEIERLTAGFMDSDAADPAE
jgi:hypothetical protein